MCCTCALAASPYIGTTPTELRHLHHVIAHSTWCNRPVHMPVHRLTSAIIPSILSSCTFLLTVQLTFSSLHIPDTNYY